MKIKFPNLVLAGHAQHTHTHTQFTCGLNKFLFTVPVCPHGGGVGLSELIQHLAIFDFIAVSGNLESR